jgi:hypothetical protein
VQLRSLSRASVRLPTTTRKRLVNSSSPHCAPCQTRASSPNPNSNPAQAQAHAPPRHTHPHLATLVSRWRSCHLASSRSRLRVDCRCRGSLRRLDLSVRRITRSRGVDLSRRLSMNLSRRRGRRRRRRRRRRPDGTHRHGFTTSRPSRSRIHRSSRSHRARLGVVPDPARRRLGTVHHELGEGGAPRGVGRAVVQERVGDFEREEAEHLSGSAGSTGERPAASSERRETKRETRYDRRASI